MSKKYGQQDRVSFSMGRKIGDNNYGSRDVHVSYSTDVEDDESPEEALARAQKFVRTQLKKARKRRR